MENTKTPITGINKLKLKFTTSEKVFGGFATDHAEVKILQTGFGFAVVAECGKSWDVNNSHIIFKPGDNEQFLYAQCPRDQGKAELVRSDSELFDSDTHYLIFWRKGTYNDLNF